MTGRSGLLAMTAFGLALVVAAVGSAAVGPDARAAVWIGAVVAGGVQAGLFLLLPALLGPAHRFLAYGLGMLARFGVFALVALLGLPALQVPAAPLLFSFVAVLFVTTLLEPFFLHTRDTTVS